VFVTLVLAGIAWKRVLVVCAVLWVVECAGRRSAQQRQRRGLRIDVQVGSAAVFGCWQLCWNLGAGGNGV
jgi:hypothetical protein